MSRYRAIAAVGVSAGIAAQQYFSNYQAFAAYQSIRAVCHVGPNGKPCHGAEESGKSVSGCVHFEDTGDICHISYHITGLPPGPHGFHIHEFADFSNGCISAGPHWNPHKKTHGGPSMFMIC